ncbi:hypothetical protein ACVIRO_002359 [Rhizobium ruizarguesonis]
MTDTKHFMQALASGIDEILNGNGLPKKNGFVVLVFPLDQVEGSRTNYVSNCDRRDIIAALKEVTARFEGQPHQTGRA